MKTVELIKTATEAAKKEIKEAEDPHAKFLETSEKIRELALKAPASERAVARAAVMNAFEELRNAASTTASEIPEGFEVFQRTDDDLWVATRLSDGYIAVAATKTAAIETAKNAAVKTVKPAKVVYITDDAFLSEKA